MPRPKSLVPKLCVHRSTNRACVYIDRQVVYLGPAGSEESRLAYAAVISRLTTGDSLAEIAKSPKPTKPVRRTVNELVLRFATERLPGYARAEQVCQRSATTVLCDLFGDTPTDDFGPVRGDARALIR